MRKLDLLCGAAVALLAATPVFAQDAAPAPAAAAAAEDAGLGDIVVTAQRKGERLQDVPISVSAFTGDALKSQQINNATQLQLSLPNVTFTKTNFTSSSFTIRGIGDLCVGFACDTATGIHVNDMPLLSTRLFETEYFDLERVEVLRGPQGTLFGRNATSGVVNFITARPDLSGFSASGSAEYGNYNSIRGEGMVNLPVTETLGVRLAGYYLNRDGFTKNINPAAKSRVDDRDLYALRGTVRWEPTENTTLDVIGYYFHEKDNRSRIQKQLCHRDPTGILGCQPDRLGFELANGNATLATVLSSTEFFRLNSPTLAPFALGSVYGPDQSFGGLSMPRDLRTVDIDFTPTYYAREYHVMGRLEQRLGDQFKLTLTGGYADNRVDSRTDYNLAATNPLTNNPGLLALAFASQAPGSPFANVAKALIPNGPAGPVCTSNIDSSLTGVYGGHPISCSPTSADYDRSQSHARQYSIEGHVDSSLDGPFNFLLGGIYVDQKTTQGNYGVASFGLDYAAGILGAAQTLQQKAANPAFPASFLAPPYYFNNTDLFTIKSYGLFGEAYFEASDRLKLTAGLRYSHDKKFVRARSPIASFLVPYGVTDANDSPFIGLYDADPGRPGVQPFAERQVSFGRLTGRAVMDFKVTPDNLLYASYSRGYKSGGINPPIPTEFNVSETFAPEAVNAFEIGTKNTFANGTIRLNASAFYYQYKNLQLSRIVARTSVNDNTDADIWGVEVETILKPDPRWLINLSASYLSTSIKSKFLVDARDVSGGRSDAVIIKDITNASNCVVTGPSAAATNAYVNAFNSGIGLRPTVPVPGTNTTGAYSVCTVLASTAANPPAALRTAFGVASGPLPFTVSDGVPVNIEGNHLPNAPAFKASAGIQYTADLPGGLTLIPRADLTFTGEQYSRSFNDPIDRIPSFTQANAQVQLNGPNDRWFVRSFVSNLFNSNAITGQYVTDQSSGLFTNIFTLEPRRYGVAAGFKF
ncbi:TonB-dependent receptor [Sphingomonas tabacisoli]|uniref:TonB-dependent receptor n=1 Tax=Sphingomonas tabacisoli TaxID=2249466 RepID=A0ABW4I713_9SPHN